MLEAAGMVIGRPSRKEYTPLPAGGRMASRCLVGQTQGSSGVVQAGSFPAGSRRANPPTRRTMRRQRVAHSVWSTHRAAHTSWNTHHGTHILWHTRSVANTACGTHILAHTLWNTQCGAHTSWHTHCVAHTAWNTSCGTHTAWNTSC